MGREDDVLFDYYLLIVLPCLVHLLLETKVFTGEKNQLMIDLGLSIRQLFTEGDKSLTTAKTSEVSSRAWEHFKEKVPIRAYRDRVLARALNKPSEEAPRRSQTGTPFHQNTPTVTNVEIPEQVLVDVRYLTRIMMDFSYRDEEPLVSAGCEFMEVVEKLYPGVIAEAHKTQDYTREQIRYILATHRLLLASSRYPYLLRTMEHLSWQYGVQRSSRLNSWLQQQPAVRTAFHFNYILYNWEVFQLDCRTWLSQTSADLRTANKIIQEISPHWWNDKPQRYLRELIGSQTVENGLQVFERCSVPNVFQVPNCIKS
jgi:hypothetical protein